MDVSKLPRLSNTETPAPREPQEPDPPIAPLPAQPIPVQPIDYRAAEHVAAPGGPEAWISGVMGALLLLLNPRLIQYLTSPGTFAQKWTFSDVNGNPITYPHSDFIWGDIAINSFCVVLILDALVLLKARNRALIAVAFVVTVATVAMNLGWFLWSFNTYGVAIMSALAVGYGGYIAIYEWRLIKMLKPRPV